jgi:hypothetical protein
MRAAGVPLVMASTAYFMSDLMRIGLGVDDDDEYRFDKINDFTVTHRLLIPNYFSDDEDDAISIPLPYGLNVYWAAGVYANKFAHGKGKPADTAISMAQTAWQSFNPVGGEVSGEGAGYSAFKTAIPTVFIPPFEMITNRDFRGLPIMPDQFPYGPKAPDSQTYHRWTGKWAKETAEFLNKVTGGNEYNSGLVDVSPNQLEFLINSYLGGAGNFGISLVQSTEQVVDHMTGEKAMTADDVRRIPMGRVFFSSVPNSASRNAWYENRDEMDQLVWEYESRYDNEGREAAEAFWDENANILNLSQYKDEIATATNRLWRILRQNPDMPQDEADEILEEIKGLYDEFNAEVNRAKGSAASQHPKPGRLNQLLGQ